MPRTGHGSRLPLAPAGEADGRLVDLLTERSQLMEDLHRLEGELARTRDLARSTARFRDVIERNADAVVVVDRDGVIRFANAMARELFAAHQSDLLGTSFGFPLVTGARA